MHSTTRDPDALLCEACGYALAGLPDDALCPECGRPVANSLPERRPGSPWQRRPSPGAWATTSLGALLRPISIWERVRIETPTSVALAVVNSVVAGALALAAPAAIAWRGGDLRLTLSLALVATPLAGFVVFLLTWIEFFGIRFFGNRRGWRITRSVAWTVCAHAGVGWVVGGMLASGLYLAGATLWPHYPIVRGAGGSRLVFLLPTPPVLLLLASALAGMLLFETLVWVGLQRCRFGNGVRVH